MKKDCCLLRPDCVNDADLLFFVTYGWNMPLFANGRVLPNVTSVGEKDTYINCLEHAMKFSKACTCFLNSMQGNLKKHVRLFLEKCVLVDLLISVVFGFVGMFV